MTSMGVIMPSLATVAMAPATAVARGWWPALLPPNFSLDTSYTAKYSACAGLHHVAHLPVI